MEEFVQQLATGLATGSVYAMLALAIDPRHAAPGRISRILQVCCWAR